MLVFHCGGPIGTIAVTSLIENHKYNTLSKQEKITYLTNKLNSSSYQYPPSIAFVPRFGGASLALWSKAKKNMQEELERLKSEDYKK